MKRIALLHAVAIVVLVRGAGCADEKPTTRPLTMEERQDKALADPMNYKPDLPESSTASRVRVSTPSSADGCSPC